jgi:pyruvate dehydrogenase E2 component (dihydrolipoamide acetyltransferase)
LLFGSEGISVKWFDDRMDVKVPNLGEGAESGTVVSILVKEGDQITKGQTIIEMENEKAVAPIPSPASGTVAKIRVKEGEKISVGQIILTTSDGAPQAGGEPKNAAQPQKRAEPESEKSAETGEPEEPAHAGVPPAAAPSIRKIARELGIDLARVRGSEAGGRIVMSDLRAYIQRLQKLASQPKAGSATPARVVESIDFSKWGEITKKPLSSIRKTIAEHMSRNWNTIPHVTQFDEADITNLMELRKKYSAAYEAKGARLTLTSFALKAVVAALTKHPIFNSSLDEAANEIVFKEYYHIGLAVDTDQGLIVPVIRNVDKKSVFDLSKEVSELAEKARDRKVSLEDLKGSTFTISNQGGIGGAHFTPIVNKPDAAILGLGRGTVKPVVRDKKIEIRMMLPIAVSYDHRLIDGGTAARFTVDLVQAFENFNEELLKI